MHYFGGNAGFIARVQVWLAFLGIVTMGHKNYLYHNPFHIPVVISDIFAIVEPDRIPYSQFQFSK